MANWKQHGAGSSIAAGDSDSLYFSSDFADDELEVAGIMLRLPHFIKKSESFHRFPASWGAKRKRSAVDCPESGSPAPAPEFAPVTEKAEDASTSPTSPLGAFFSATDSDSKPARSNKKVSTGLKDELLKQCEELSDIGELLRREIKKVEGYHDELMAENIILQRRRQQASLVALQLTQSQPLVPSALQPHHQQQPLMVFPYQQVGPRGIPDLNVRPEEYGAASGRPQPSDLEYHNHMAAKAAAALARRNRSLIQKAKSSGRMPRGGT